MTLRALQPEALAVLDAAIARGEHVVDPNLIAGARARIGWLVGDGAQPAPAEDDRAHAAFVVVEQELLDVAGLDDATVQAAAERVGGGQLADLVMTSYAIEARERLRIAADRLLGGYE